MQVHEGGFVNLLMAFLWPCKYWEFLCTWKHHANLGVLMVGDSPSFPTKLASSHKRKRKRKRVSTVTNLGVIEVRSSSSSSRDCSRDKTSCKFRPLGDSTHRDNWNLVKLLSRDLGCRFTPSHSVSFPADERHLAIIFQFPEGSQALIDPLATMVTGWFIRCTEDACDLNHPK